MNQSSEMAQLRPEFRKTKDQAHLVPGLGLGKFTLKSPLPWTLERQGAFDKGKQGSYMIHGLI